MSSAFFVVMGGFAYRREQKFNVPNEELKFPNLILTPKGFLLLAQRKVLHPGILDQESILDRSKADSLAKLLVCAQAFWMVVNVIRRKSSGLPSTLIELHVVTHAIVTVIVYGLWWHKPLGVNNPIILNPLKDYLNQRITTKFFVADNHIDQALLELHLHISLLHYEDNNPSLDTTISFYPSDYFSLDSYQYPIDENHRKHVNLLQGCNINISQELVSGFKLEAHYDDEAMKRVNQQWITSSLRFKIQALNPNSIGSELKWIVLLPNQRVLWETPHKDFVFNFPYLSRLLIVTE